MKTVSQTHRTPARFCWLAFSLSLFALPAQADRAYFYQWMSQVDGTRVCTQIPPGAGWKKTGGPFEDSRCTKKKSL